MQTRTHFRSFTFSGIAILGLASCLCRSALCDDEELPISAVEARKKIDQTVFVELTVKAAKDRLEKRGEIYLDSEEDFKNEKNLATVITRDGAAEFRNNGINDPAEHFRNKKIRVRGKVIVKEDRPRIEVNEFKQIELVKES